MYLVKKMFSDFSRGGGASPHATPKYATVHNHPLLSEKTLPEHGMVQYSADGEFADRKIRKVEKTENSRKESTEDLMEKGGFTAVEKILSTQKKLFEGIGRLRDPRNDEPILTHIQIKREAEPVIQPQRVISTT